MQNWQTKLRDRASSIGIGGLAALVLGFLAWRLGSQPKWLPQVLLIGGVILAGTFILLRPGQVRIFLTGRQARYGSNALIMSLALLGILFFVNVWSNSNHKRWDLTQGKRYSLSAQTIAILKDLKEPIQITGFYVPDESSLRQEVDDLLKEYRYYTNLLQVEYVDPDKQPGLARQLDIKSTGVLVFQRGTRKQETFVTDEQSITGAILKVSRDSQKTVYFTTGHGEHDPQNTDQDGYSQMKTALERDNYLVQTLNLATITTTIPSDAEVVIVAGPLGPFAPQETQLLMDYLGRPGKVMILADPTVDTGLDTLLATWGVNLGNDVIIDTSSSFYGDIATPLMSRYRFHTITKDLSGLSTFFPLARSISATVTMTDRMATVLMESSADSWGETDLENRQANFDAAKDTRGPLALAVTVETTGDGKPARLVVLGDSDFAANNSLSVRGLAGNSDLFRNGVNWLAEEEALVSIASKPSETRQTRPLTPGDERLILYVTVIFLPLTILLAGGFVWWNRR